MDPASMILAALVSGAVSAVQETAGTAIKDAYKGLHDLLMRKFENDPKARTALQKQGASLQKEQNTLKGAISSNKIYEDKDVLRAAKKLATLLERQADADEYSVTIHGDVKGLVQGKTPHVTINFDEGGTKSTKKKH